MDKWTKYFEKLLNYNDLPEELLRTKTLSNESVCPTPSKQEILLQIKRFKNHKFPGENGI